MPPDILVQSENMAASVALPSNHLRERRFKRPASSMRRHRGHTGSITQAAERLFMAQPHSSKAGNL